MTSRRRPIRTAATLALAAAIGATLAAATTSQAATRKDCGGRDATTLAKSSSIRLVVRERGADDDLYGGDHRYSACHGKHGKTRMLMDLRSPNYPLVGLIGLRGRYAAMEISVSDAACGKDGSTDCPISRYVSAWDVRTGRQVSHAAPQGPLSALAVSPRGALAWVEPAVAPATGVRIRAVLGELGETTVGTSQAPVTGLTISRSLVRWQDAAGPHSAPVPPRSVLP